MQERGLDLGQSDVYTGYTYQYVWAADQLGHFAIGFIVNWFVLGITRFFYDPAVHYFYLITLILMLIYLAKESGDISKVFRARGNIVPSRKWNNFIDSITDSFFVLFGAIASYLAIFDFAVASSYWFLLAAVALMVIGLSIKPVRYNRRFDNSGIPCKVNIFNLCYELRDPLSQKTIPELHALLKDFILLKDSVKTLSITGKDSSGKSTLSWGIGTYVSIAGYQVAFKAKKEDFSFIGDPKYSKAKLLILDELDREDALEGEFVQNFLQKCPVNTHLLLVYEDENLPQNAENNIIVQKRRCGK